MPASAATSTHRVRIQRVVATVLAVVLSVAVHVWLLLAAVALDVGSWFRTDPPQSPRAVSLVILSPDEEEDDVVEEEEPEKPDLDGQLVDIAPPEVEEAPKEADFIAEHNSTVEKETRSERFEVNPEILAPEWSDDQKAELENLNDVNAVDPSTGAQVGNDRYEPDRAGRLPSIPSPFTVTNKEGSEAPVPASASQSVLQGAPNNDLLDVERGQEVALNTKEFLYAGYLNRVRRLVNFYWSQNLDNVPSGLRLTKSSYATGVEAVLDADGHLESLVVVMESGSPELDYAVVHAFELAGPFPNPPEGLIEADGRVYLPSMSFTVRLGHARNPYQGIDPRAGVQFPGILKTPR